MQLKTKDFIILLLVGSAALCFYYGFRNEDNVSKTKTYIETPTKTPLTPQKTRTGEVETDTGRRIETFGNSGTQWGMNPFGSGKPLTEAEEEKPKFQKPNTEWKTRTMSGITYVFGEGNPKEVALNQLDLENLRKKCGTAVDPENMGYLCKETDGYVNADVEKYLLRALSDPNWQILLTQCEENLRYTEEGIQSPATMYNPQEPLNFSIVAYSDFLDINKWLLIDSIGRKTIDFGRLHSLQEWLSSGFEASWNQREWPLHKNGSRWIFKNPSCVDTYGAEILRNLIIARITYLGAGQELGDYQERYKTTQMFINNFFQ